MDDFENNTELSPRTDAHLKHLGLMIDGETQVGAETLKSAHDRLRKDLKAFVNDFRKHQYRYRRQWGKYIRIRPKVSQGQFLTKAFFDRQLQSQHWSIGHISAWDLENVSYKQVQVKGKNLQEAILEYIDENDSDLLAMMNRKYSFFERILIRQNVDQIEFHVQIPFLVVRDTGREARPKLIHIISHCKKSSYLWSKTIFKTINMENLVGIDRKKAEQLVVGLNI